MRKRCNTVLVVCSVIFLMAGSSQPAGAATPNLGRAPGQGGDSANGLVTEVVLPQLGLGNTGQALSGPALNYLGVTVGGDDLVLDSAFYGDTLSVSIPLSLSGSAMAIPEPATLGMLGFGAVVLILKRKRKRA